jgi:hypothetical protein
VLCRGQELLRLRMVEQPNVLLAIIFMYVHNPGELCAVSRSGAVEVEDG